MRIAVLPGDGVGPEVVAAAVSVLDSVTDRLEMTTADIGLDCLRRTGECLPRDTMDIVDEADAVLFGTVIDPAEDRNYRNPLIALKRRMDLYANIRPIVRLAPDIGMRDIDVIVVRENLEGIYAMVESEDLDGATLERRVSIGSCKRICRMARRVAEERSRRRVTCIHKADMLRVSDGLFRSIFLEEMSGSPVHADDMLVDDAVSGMILRPEGFDVLVTLNLYGDTLSEIASALAGGCLSPSGNIGDRKGLFEPTHGPMPELTGLNEANPVSCILSAAMMLDFLGMRKESETVHGAVRTALAAGLRTRDLGGDAGTYEFAERVAGLCRQSLHGME